MATTKKDNYTKTSLVNDLLVKFPNFSRKDLLSIYEETFSLIKENSKDKRVKIDDFGIFEIKIKDAKPKAKFSPAKVFNWHGYDEKAQKEALAENARILATKVKGVNNFKKPLRDKELIQ